MAFSASREAVWRSDMGISASREAVWRADTTISASSDVVWGSYMAIYVHQEGQSMGPVWLYPMTGLIMMSSNDVNMTSYITSFPTSS